MESRIPLDGERLSALCRARHIRRLALFGSVLRDDFGPDSDVDILVEFEPDHTPGLAFFDIQEELSRLVGRTVDLHTAASLSGSIRERVVDEAEVQFDAA